MHLYLLLPYPPSVNTYWGFQGSRRFLTKRAVAYKREVLEAFRAKNHPGFGAAHVRVVILLSPPDKRRRDIDNGIKSLLDSLTQAKVFDDDSQVDWLWVERQPIKKGGQCLVFIDEIK